MEIGGIGYRRVPLIGSRGFQPYLIFGMIEAEDRKVLRKAVVDFMEHIRNDVLYNTISSVALKRVGMYMPVEITQR